jgi:hypothetical protein
VGERSLCKRDVVSSNLSTSTTEKPVNDRLFAFQDFVLEGQNLVCDQAVTHRAFMSTFQSPRLTRFSSSFRSRRTNAAAKARASSLVRGGLVGIRTRGFLVAASISSPRSLERPELATARRRDRRRSLSSPRAAHACKYQA